MASLLISQSSPHSIFTRCPYPCVNLHYFTPTKTIKLLKHPFPKNVTTPWWFNASINFFHTSDWAYRLDIHPLELEFLLQPMRGYSFPCHAWHQNHHLAAQIPIHGSMLFPASSKEFSKLKVSEFFQYSLQRQCF